jgi:hypothetical protein
MTADTGTFEFRRGHHRCPHGCGKQIPDRLFACPQGWHQLDEDRRNEIYRTAGMALTNPRRQRAIAAAVAVYGAAAPPEWRVFTPAEE